MRFTNAVANQGLSVSHLASVPRRSVSLEPIKFEKRCPLAPASGSLRFVE